MKVLHVINNLGSGGAESMLISFMKELMHNTNDSFEILLLVNNKISYKVPDGIKIHVLSKSPKRFSFIKLYSLCKFVKRNEYDIIHAHLFPTQYYIAFCKILNSRIKIVTTEHNTTNKRRKLLITKTIDRIIYSLYDKIIFISDGVKKQFLLDYKQFFKKGIIINNGVPLDTFVLRDNKKLNEVLKLLMVARFSKQKDHKTLIKAILLLNKKYHLSLVGEGEEQERIKEFVIQNNLENRVTFLGFQSNISAVYSEHDIFILSSYWEGFGLVAIEAMASGLPVIASDVSGLSEVVQGAGLLFEQGNEKDLAKKIELISDKKNYKDFVRKGLERAKNYDIKELVYNTQNVYKDLIL